MLTRCNGYKIRWNGYWRTWQVSHPEIGVCGDAKSLKDAVEYCEKG